MKFAVVGVGGAGGRIAAAIREQEDATGLSMTDGHVLVFDTDRAALEELEAIPEDRRVPIGDTYEAVEGDGVHGDPELAADVARSDDYEIQRAFDDIPIEDDLDGVIVVGGLGGATGAGAGAAIIQICQDLFDDPVYAIATLPRVDDGDQAAINAARGLQSYVRLADNVLTFDNESWIDAEPADYGSVNAELADRVVRLLALGDFDGAIAEARVDRTDVIRTLATGGVSSIGAASVTLDWGWRRWFRWLPWVTFPAEDVENQALRVKNLVRQAVDSSMTLPCEVSSTERALIVLAGPPSALSRKGFESARYWLEEEADSVEIIAGDEPQPNSTTLTATVLLSNVTDVPRIEALKQQATDAATEKQDRTTARPALSEQG